MNPAMPDLTKAQYGAFVQGAIALAASFGFQLSQAHSIELLSLSGVFAIGLMYADKEIRRGRALALAAHVGNYSFKTAVMDAALGAAPPAPSPDAPVPVADPVPVDVPAPVILPDPALAVITDPPTPPTIGQP